MNFFHAAILGLVEGLTEFLPVSSTGHLILVSRWMGLPADTFVKTFEVAIQSGAMIAVLWLYGKRFLVEPVTRLRVAAAFLPAAALGFIFHKKIKALLGNPDVVLIALLAGGFVLIALDVFYRDAHVRVRRTSELTWAQSVLIGFCQTLAFIPGVSRSGATIAGGLALKLDRATAMEFSFLLAVPTLLAATALDLVKTSTSFTGREWALLATGAVVSFVVAVITIKLFLNFVQKRGFSFFGYYRIALAATLWFLGR